MVLRPRGSPIALGTPRHGATPTPGEPMPLRPLLAATALALVASVTSATGAGSAATGNVVTPGSFRGFGFDQCLAPSQHAMDAWLDHSPFLAVGIYTSGASRACRSQPNLTPTWISTQLH